MTAFISRRRAKRTAARILSAAASLLAALALANCGGNVNININNGGSGSTTQSKPVAWAWVGGSNKVFPADHYGVQGVAAASNTPPGLETASILRDANGDVWVFGGSGMSYGTTQMANSIFNTLWKYSPSTGLWTWVSGGNGNDFTAKNASYAVYGTQGVADAANHPGARIDASLWVDANNNLWVFGGGGDDANTSDVGTLGDLWMFNTKTNLWTWIGGSTLCYHGAGVYGVKGVANAANFPGIRDGAVSLQTSPGKFWLFGGIGADSTNAISNTMSDLWSFDPKTRLWTWVSGDNIANTTGVYGVKGQAATGDIPAGRYYASGWVDAHGDLWIFGGLNQQNANLNDLWKYTVATGQWTWVSGSKTTDPFGVYGTQYVGQADNTPSGRNMAVTWTTKDGSLWLFGGRGMSTQGVGDLNDFWKFDPSSGYWTWMGGSQTTEQAPMMGDKGASSTTYAPGGLRGGMGWSDADGNLWLFGGYQFDAINSSGNMNILWKATPQ